MEHKWHKSIVIKKSKLAKQVMNAAIDQTHTCWSSQGTASESYVWACFCTRLNSQLANIFCLFFFPCKQHACNPLHPTGLLALVQIYYGIDLFTPSLANSTYCVCKEIHYSRGQTLFHYTSRETCWQLMQLILVLIVHSFTSPIEGCAQIHKPPPRKTEFLKS